MCVCVLNTGKSCIYILSLIFLRARAFSGLSIISLLSSRISRSHVLGSPPTHRPVSEFLIEREQLARTCRFTIATQICPSPLLPPSITLSSSNESTGTATINLPRLRGVPLVFVSFPSFPKSLVTLSMQR